MASENQNEKFVEYSAGSDALPWKGWLEDQEGQTTGWLEDQEGQTTGWVDLRGNVHRLTGETAGGTGVMAVRSSCWNAVRDSVLAVSDLPHEPEATDYWPKSNLSCLLSLTMKYIDRRIGKADELEASRLRFMRSHIEVFFAASEAFGLAAATSPSQAE